MLINVHQENPAKRQLDHIIDVLEKGGIIIYPTDSVYGFGCSMNSRRGPEKIARIKGISAKDLNFSFICTDLSQIASLTLPIPNNVFKVMKKVLPGPYTFVLNAAPKISKLAFNKKRTIGVRIPDNNITFEIVRKLGDPIISTSVYDEDEILEYTTDPELIYEKYQNQVDLVVNGGNSGNLASTVLDCTGEEIVVIREGKGKVDDIF